MTGRTGKWDGKGGTYKHDVFDIVKGHSSCLICLACIMNMSDFNVT